MELMELLDRGIALISARSSQALVAAQVAALGTVLILGLSTLRRARRRSAEDRPRPPRSRRAMRKVRPARLQERPQAPESVATSRPQACPEPLRRRIDALEARIQALQTHP